MKITTRSTKELTGPITGMDITKEKMNSPKKCVTRDYKDQSGTPTHTISEFHMTNKQQKRELCYGLTELITELRITTNSRSQLLIVLYPKQR